MFLLTIEEINGEFEYFHHMLLSTIDGISDKELIEDFYGEGAVGDDAAHQYRKGFYWVWGDLLACVQSIKSLTEDESPTLMKFLFGSRGQLLVGRQMEYGDGE